MAKTMPIEVASSSSSSSSLVATDTPIDERFHAFFNITVVLVDNGVFVDVVVVELIIIVVDDVVVFCCERANPNIGTFL
jgi:hypothetical protein